MSDTVQTHADRLVSHNVLVCMSSMVAMLARGYGTSDSSMAGLSALTEQAMELCSPGLDYQEAATQAGWIYTGNVWTMPCDDDSGIDPEFGSAEDACEFSDVDPYEWEVFEHWAVSAWLAEKLQEAGERVDTDFAGLNVWARTTTGQAISMDSVILKIAADLHA